jgi:DNA mismatch repair protein MutL
VETVNESPRIKVLPPGEAKKIAAGEVIDRPAALVRELIDNAIDSGARTIELSIEGGGIHKVEVSDDGSGMTKEDLELCTKTHATSKIRSLDDLSSTLTLGFRGEALAAAAAVARLEILSSADGREAWLLEASQSQAQLSRSRRNRGTSVRTLGLFDAIPARKRFLKREGTEGNLCRQIFVEKALAFPRIAFHFFQDGGLKLHLLPLEQEIPQAQDPAGQSPAAGLHPSAASCKARFGELILKEGERPFLHQVSAVGEGFTVTVIFGGAEVYRQDRRQQYVFANRRRIQDFSLLQALEYGLAGLFPNGTHPVGAVFVEINPALVDFNIHPAKREVRFADAGAIHHTVSGVLRDYVRSRGIGGEVQRKDDAGGPALFGGQFSGSGPAFSAPYGTAPYGAAGQTAAMAAEALLARRGEFAPLPRREEAGGYAGNSAGEETAEYNGDVRDKTPGPVRLIGRAFDLFIIVESGDRLYLIDQHAAHERLLYNRFLSKKITTQELLITIPFTTGSGDDDRFLQSHKNELAELGVVVENDGDACWRIEALPAGWNMSDDETVEEILALKDAGENIAERWAATLSCRAAVKDGDRLDDNAALALAEAALSFPIACCPHGRPLWTEIGREELFKAVRRT